MLFYPLQPIKSWADGSFPASGARVRMQGAGLGAGPGDSQGLGGDDAGGEGGVRGSERGEGQTRSRRGRAASVAARQALAWSSGALLSRGKLRCFLAPRHHCPGRRWLPAGSRPPAAARRRGSVWRGHGKPPALPQSRVCRSSAGMCIPPQVPDQSEVGLGRAWSALRCAGERGLGEPEGLLVAGEG